MDLKVPVKKIIWNTDKLSNFLNFESKTTTADYPSYICNELSKELKVSALKITRNDKRKHFLATTLACVVCSKAYQFNISWDELKTGKNITISVFSDQNICDHPEQQVSRYVRRKEREKIAKDLGNKSVRQHQDKQLQLLNQDLLQSTGNLQSFYSPEVLMKIRSEQKASKDLDNNDLVDVYLKSLSSDNFFIRNLSSFPFSCQVNFDLND
jgi:hypothetical protein